MEVVKKLDARDAVSISGLELEMSTDPEFKENKYIHRDIAPEATSFRPPPSAMPRKPLCDQVVYFRLRAVSSDGARVLERGVQLRRHG